jgi:hypothetical protein
MLLFQKFKKILQFPVFLQKIFFCKILLKFYTKNFHLNKEIYLCLSKTFFLHTHIQVII